MFCGCRSDVHGSLLDLHSSLIRGLQWCLMYMQHLVKCWIAKPIIYPKLQALILSNGLAQWRVDKWWYSFCVCDQTLKVEDFMGIKVHTNYTSLVSSYPATRSWWHAFVDTNGDPSRFSNALTSFFGFVDWFALLPDVFFHFGQPRLATGCRLSRNAIQRSKPNATRTKNYQGTFHCPKYAAMINQLWIELNSIFTVRSHTLSKKIYCINVDKNRKKDSQATLLQTSRYFRRDSAKAAKPSWLFNGSSVYVSPLTAA